MKSKWSSKKIVFPKMPPVEKKADGTYGITKIKKAIAQYLGPHSAPPKSTENQKKAHKKKREKILATINLQAAIGLEANTKESVSSRKRKLIEAFSNSYSEINQHYLDYSNYEVEEENVGDVE